MNNIEACHSLLVRPIERKLKNEQKKVIEDRIFSYNNLIRLTINVQDLALFDSIKLREQKSRQPCCKISKDTLVTVTKLVGNSIERNCEL